MYVCTYVFILWCSYLFAYAVGSGSIKPAISLNETVEDRAKVTINGRYKVVDWLLISAKLYDLE